MNTSLLEGVTLRRLLLGGADGIRHNIKEINELNVFPVPDGDTGTNMYETLEGGISKLPESDGATLGEVASAFARGALFGARGNSGVILSQFIAGFCSALSDKESASVRELAEAGLTGVERAYSAVANPVEGTMLTVMRESTDYVMKQIDEIETVEQLIALIIDEARRSLARTKDILPVLKEADVVDSGGAGYLAITEGMYRVISGKAVETEYTHTEEKRNSTVNYDLFTSDTRLEFGYCTECLVRLQRFKAEPESFDRDAFTAELEAKGCNSIVLLRDADLLKLHAHTMTPSVILDMCQRYGEFLQVKIENMCLQHSERMQVEQKKKMNHKTYGIVAVATGDGMSALFRELGADVIIGGGQTCNPSAEEFINAFSELDVDHILVLPNNSNILLAAAQAKELWDGADVTVIPSKTFPAGYTALSVFNPTVKDPEEQVEDMISAMSEVASGEVTVAIRDATVGGVSVKEGEAIAILDGELVASAPTVKDALLDMIGCVEDIEDKELLTLFVGSDVSDEERIDVADSIEERFDNLSVEVLIGGQEVYNYLISVE